MFPAAECNAGLRVTVVGCCSCGSCWFDCCCCCCACTFNSMPVSCPFSSASVVVLSLRPFNNKEIKKIQFKGKEKLLVNVIMQKYCHLHFLKAIVLLVEKRYINSTKWTFYKNCNDAKITIILKWKTMFTSFRVFLNLKVFLLWAFCRWSLEVSDDGPL